MVRLKEVAPRSVVGTEGPGVRRSIMGRGLMGCSCRSITIVIFLELLSKRPPLVRSHVLPLLPHLMALFGRQGSKPLPGVADGLPSLRWQFAKTLKPFTQRLLLLLGHLLPLLEPLPGLAPFLLIHGRPLSRAVAQPFLPFGRQLIPVLVELSERLLFVLA